MCPCAQPCSNAEECLQQWLCCSRRMKICFAIYYAIPMRRFSRPQLCQNNMGRGAWQNGLALHPPDLGGLGTLCTRRLTHCQNAEANRTGRDCWLNATIISQTMLHRHVSNERTGPSCLLSAHLFRVRVAESTEVQTETFPSEESSLRSPRLARSYSPASHRGRG